MAASFKIRGDFTKGVATALFLQTIMGALTAVFTFIMGTIFLPYWAAFTAGLLTALSPHLVAAGSYLLTETLFTFLLAAGLTVLFISLKHSKMSLVFISSVLLGLANLVRPALLLFPIPILFLMLFIWKSKKRHAAALLMAAGFIIVWLPWSIWSKTAVAPDTGKVSLVASVFALGIYPDLIHKDPRLKGFPYREDMDTYRKMTHDMDFALNTLRERASKEPFKYLRWYVVGKPAMYWSWNILNGAGDVYIYPVKKSYYQESGLAGLSRAAMKLTHFPMVLLALAGLVILGYRAFKTRLRDEDLLLPLLIYSLIIYFTLIHTVLAPLPRYAIPLRPYLYLSSLLAIQWIWRGRKSFPHMSSKD